MKLPKQGYTTEFKEQAVAQVACGRGIAASRGSPACEYSEYLRSVADEWHSLQGEKQ
jgi:hypothetical protein